MSTTAEQAIASKVATLSPEWRRHVGEVLALLAMGDHFDSELVDVVFQSARKPLDREVAYAFAIVNMWIGQGRVRLAWFDVGISPNADALLQGQRDELELRLREHIPASVSKTLGREQHGPDGWISFDTPVEMCGYGEPVALPARISLEVGDTLAAKTWFQLVRQRTLARWPYGSEKVWIFHAPDALVDMGL